VAQGTPAPQRIVVVGAGFALWVGSRCTAAVRWADVVRVRASITAAGTLAIRAEMADENAIELEESAPGFDLFLDRAAVMLHGLAPFKSWHPALATAGVAGALVTIYERPARLR